MGYWRAGFDVIGIDIAPQHNYLFPCFQADAMTFPIRGFDAVHASPPCQSYSAMTNCRPGLADEYSALVPQVRDRFEEAGVPWVIENVVGAPLASGHSLFGNSGVVLCGRMFGLPLYRHRLFESSVPLAQPEHPAHAIPASRAGHWEPGTIISVSGNCSPIAVAREAMGISWMNRNELSEAVPPAYTRYVGEQLLNSLEFAA